MPEIEGKKIISQETKGNLHIKLEETITRTIQLEDKDENEVLQFCLDFYENILIDDPETLEDYGLGYVTEDSIVFNLVSFLNKGIIDTTTRDHDDYYDNTDSERLSKKYLEIVPKIEELVKQGYQRLYG